MGRGSEDALYIDREVSPAAEREMDRLLGEWQDHEDGVLESQEEDEGERVEEYLLALYEKDEHFFLMAAEKSSWFELQDFSPPDEIYLQEIEEYLLSQGIEVEESEDGGFLLPGDIDPEEVRQTLLQLEDEQFIYSEEVEDFFS